MLERSDLLFDRLTYGVPMRDHPFLALVYFHRGPDRVYRTVMHMLTEEEQQDVCEVLDAIDPFNRVYGRD